MVDKPLARAEFQVWSGVFCSSGEWGSGLPSLGWYEMVCGSVPASWHWAVGRAEIEGIRHEEGECLWKRLSATLAIALSMLSTEQISGKQLKQHRTGGTETTNTTDRTDHTGPLGSGSSPSARSGSYSALSSCHSGCVARLSRGRGARVRFVPIGRVCTGGAT